MCVCVWDKGEILFTFVLVCVCKTKEVSYLRLCLCVTRRTAVSYLFFLFFRDVEESAVAFVLVCLGDRSKRSIVRVWVFPETESRNKERRAVFKKDKCGSNETRKKETYNGRNHKQTTVKGAGCKPYAVKITDCLALEWVILHSSTCVNK